MDDTAIICEGLTREFSSGRAVDGLSFTLPAGSVLALLGHNGAGKTTTVRLLNGILAPSSGSARVLGFDPIAQGDQLRTRTAVVSELSGLDERLSPRQNLRATARVRGMDPSLSEPRIESLLDQFGLSRQIDMKCRGFSTGQRRRATLATALLDDPQLLFLDEPTSGLDPVGTKAVMEMVAHLTTERGRSVVLCTHFLDEAAVLADFMAIIEMGRLVLFGRPEQLAAQRWHGTDVEVRLAAAADNDTLQLIASIPSVRNVVSSDQGAVATIDAEQTLPQFIREVATLELNLFGIEHRPKGLRELYFEYQRGTSLDVAPSSHASDLGAHT